MKWKMSVSFVLFVFLVAWWFPSDSVFHPKQPSMWTGYVQISSRCGRVGVMHSRLTSSVPLNAHFSDCNKSVCAAVMLSVGTFYTYYHAIKQRMSVLCSCLGVFLISAWQSALSWPCTVATLFLTSSSPPKLWFMSVKNETNWLYSIQIFIYFDKFCSAWKTKNYSLTLDTQEVGMCIAGCQCPNNNQRRCTVQPEQSVI